MREIRSVIVTIAKPSGPGDLGQTEEGRYFVEGGWLTLTDEGGTPLRDNNTGARITMRLLPGDDERAIAKKLTLRRWREASRDELAGFGRVLRYPSHGWA